jgi:hypothetical protein
LSETIDTLAPQIAFTSDDFPTFGRPTIVTNPHRKSSGQLGVASITWPFWR